MGNIQPTLAGHGSLVGFAAVGGKSVVSVANSTCTSLSGSYKAPILTTSPFRPLRTPTGPNLYPTCLTSLFGPNGAYFGLFRAHFGHATKPPLQHASVPKRIAILLVAPIFHLHHQNTYPELPLMNYETRLVLKVAAFLLPIFVLAIRILMVLPAPNTATVVGKGVFSDFLEISGQNVMALLGSGGHTGEMLRILANVDLTNFTRTWVVSSGDSTSLEKCKTFEEQHVSKSSYKPRFVSLHRARTVGEPLVLLVKNTLISFKKTVTTLYALPELPAVLLVNGPGTSVPLAYILFAMKVLGMCKTRIIYIESLARVHLLSLSGRLIMPIADRFIVQWEQLYLQYHRAEYYGILI